MTTTADPPLKAIKDFLLYRWKVEWAFERVADTFREHPVVVALIFAEGMFVGLIVGGPLR